MGDDPAIAAISKKPSIWAVLGGTVLSIYLPPVFAIFIVNRWKDVSLRLRAAAIVLSFIFPASLWLLYGMEPSVIALAAFPLHCYSLVLMYSSFVVCWCRHSKTKVSVFLKVCFWAMMSLATIGTMLMIIAFLLKAWSAAKM